MTILEFDRLEDLVRHVLLDDRPDPLIHINPETGETEYGMQDE